MFLRSSQLLLRASRPLSTSSRNLSSLYAPTPEHAQLRQMCAQFAQDKIDPQAGQHDKTGTLNKPLLKEVADLGLLGITIPAENGGAGMDAVAACIVHHEFSKYDPGFTLAYLAHSMLFVNNFFYAANEEQRKRFLEPTMSGEMIACMGMSEPGAGTDVLGMGTHARKNGDHYILNGSKTWITNGHEADVALIYAKVDGRVSAFLVDCHAPGFTASNPIDKCGMRGSTMAELAFEDVKVPVENLLGGEGQGVKHMMRNLEIERITLAAMSVGIAERCCEVMLDYANTRQAFGKPINEFGQIQRYIAEGYAMTQAAKSLTYQVASECGPDIQNRVGTDAAKLFAAPVGKQVADYAIQVLGGAGYCREYPVERLWRDAKLLEIGGGTLEAHQKNMTKDLTKQYCS
eukprot:m.265601 g.265601  ORF g.265601 m.265601 type:complete len:403 (+) comp29247_c0_seq1:55-1263(+)